MRELVYVPMFHSAEVSAMRDEGTVYSEEVAQYAGLMSNPYWVYLRDFFGKSKWDNVRVYIEGYVEPSRLVINNGIYLTDSALWLSQLSYSPESEAFSILVSNSQRLILEKTEDENLVREGMELKHKLLMLDHQMKEKDDPEQEDVPDEVWNEFAPKLREVNIEFDANCQERDKFVGKVISDSLLEDEVGMLFMGASHKPDEYIADDIKIRPLDDYSAYYSQVMMEEIEQVRRIYFDTSLD